MKALHAVVVFLLIGLAAARPASAEYAGLDVGAPALAGQTTAVSAGSAYDVTAAGADIYATADQFHFAYRLQGGDFDVRVRVASLTATNEWSKAGLMARESMHPGSRQVSVFATPAGGYEFQYRPTAGAFVTKADSAARVSYPNTWVRLKRAGNVFTAYTSSDGFNWTQLGSRSLTLAPTLFFGMATTSHDPAQTAVAQYRDLSTVLPSGLDVGAPALPGQTTVLAPGTDYDVTAAGTDIYGTADQFHFAHKLGGPSETFALQSGDFDLRVRVASLTATDVFAKAGLMARESLHAGSRQVSLFATPAGGYEFQYRAATSGVTQKLDSAARVTYPDTWVRLKRVGNQFTAYTSPDGVEWTFLANTTLALPASVFLGLAATSHNATQSTVAKFRDHGKVDSSNDNKAPSVPGALSAAAVSHSQINLSWAASSDNVGVVGYRVFRGAAQVATTSGLAYADTGLAASTSYTYTIAAFDAAGNVSAGSTPASAVTQAPPDTTAPTAPAGLSATALSSSQIALAWSASTDNVGVAAYRVLRNGVQVATTSALAHTDAGLAASTTYNYTITAADAAGNVSPASNTASAATLAPPDTAAPSVPAGLAALAVSVSQINLSWTASTDNVAVTGYRVLRGGVQVATTTLPAYSDTGLASGTIYSYTVAAFDAAGNVSAPSGVATAATMTAPDLSAPTAPAALSATTVSSSQIRLAWSAATDNVGVAGYNVLRNGVLVGGTSALTFTDTGLAPSTTYSYTVTAADAAGNLSPASNAASATTGAGGTFPPQVRSPIGTNLEPLSYWSPQVPFVDVMKSSSEWFSGTSSDWGGGGTLDLDANGWVRSLNPGQVVRKLMLREFGDRYPGGRYLVRYKGEGSLNFGFAARVVAQRPGEMDIEVTPNDGGVYLWIDATNPANYLREIEILMPGGICEGDPFTHAASAAQCGTRRFVSFAEDRSIIFYPVFASRLRNYSVIRFMDWMQTNWSPVATWAQRTPVTYHTWAMETGAPVEVMIALANLVGAHPWFNMPHLSDEAYARSFAQMVKAQLDPALGVYVEHSNEVWNSVFSQYQYLSSQAQAQGLMLTQYHALRTRTLAAAFKAELGAARVVSVLGGQAVSTWVATSGLDYLKGRFGAGALGIDAVAIAPYFGVSPTPAEAGQFTAMTMDQFFNYVRTNVLPSEEASMRNYRAVANNYGLRFFTYEGGQHMRGVAGAEGNDALNTLFDNFNRDPRIKQLYLDYLATWKNAGGELFVHFNDVSRYTKWGRWGALEYVAQPRAESPKFDGIMTFIEQHPVWWTQ